MKFKLKRISAKILSSMLIVGGMFAVSNFGFDCGYSVCYAVEDDVARGNAIGAAQRIADMANADEANSDFEKELGIISKYSETVGVNMAEAAAKGAGELEKYIETIKPFRQAMDRAKDNLNSINCSYFASRLLTHINSIINSEMMYRNQTGATTGRSTQFMNVGFGQNNNNTQPMMGTGNMMMNNGMMNNGMMNNGMNPFNRPPMMGTGNMMMNNGMMNNGMNPFNRPPMMGTGNMMMNNGMMMNNNGVMNNGFYRQQMPMVNNNNGVMNNGFYNNNVNNAGGVNNGFYRPPMPMVNNNNGGVNNGVFNNNVNNAGGVNNSFVNNTSTTVTAPKQQQPVVNWTSEQLAQQERVNNEAARKILEERRRQEEAARKRKEEEERLRQEEAARKRKEEEERLRQEKAEREAARKRKEEEERLRQAEIDKKRKEDEERLRQAEIDKKRREDEERLRQEEAERKRQEKAEREARRKRKLEEESERKRKGKNKKHKEEVNKEEVIKPSKKKALINNNGKIYDNLDAGERGFDGNNSLINTGHGEIVSKLNKLEPAEQTSNSKKQEYMKNNVNDSDSTAFESEKEERTTIIAKRGGNNKQQYGNYANSEQQVVNDKRYKEDQGNSFDDEVVNGKQRMLKKTYINDRGNSLGDEGNAGNMPVVASQERTDRQKLMNLREEDRVFANPIRKPVAKVLKPENVVEEFEKTPVTKVKKVKKVKKESDPIKGDVNFMVEADADAREIEIDIIKRENAMGAAKRLFSVAAQAFKSLGRSVRTLMSTASFSKKGQTCLRELENFKIPEGVSDSKLLSHFADLVKRLILESKVIQNTMSKKGGIHKLCAEKVGAVLDKFSNKGIYKKILNSFEDKEIISEGLIGSDAERVKKDLVTFVKEANESLKDLRTNVVAEKKKKRVNKKKNIIANRKNKKAIRRQKSRVKRKRLIESKNSDEKISSQE